VVCGYVFWYNMHICQSVYLQDSSSYFNAFNPITQNYLEIYLYSHSFIFSLSLSLLFILTLHHYLVVGMHFGDFQILLQWHMRELSQPFQGLYTNEVTCLRTVILQSLSCTNRLCEFGQELPDVREWSPSFKDNSIKVTIDNLFWL
jgi:hypothetical protein